MNANEIRAAMPVGADRTLTLADGGRLRVTVVEHGNGVVYVGRHPSLLAVRHADIEAVAR